MKLKAVVANVAHVLGKLRGEKIIKRREARKTQNVFERMRESEVRYLVGCDD